MEENSAVLDCLVLFYINMKHVLKTKQLIDRVFVDQMIKHCKQNGFNNYSGEEIKNEWNNLVSKYIYLKTKGTAEEKEKWNYFEILDSCYEQSDFHNGVYPKFSEEMVWLLIELFLKRKNLRKTQKHSSIVSEVHKEFLQCGYLYITKQDIDNKWRNLNLKYEKLKNDPESLKKMPYLQALKGYHEENEKHIVPMVFTRELTEILIERFTEKKITCVIHGYDSDKVLNEIQSEFKDLGFYFSKDDIKDKWRKLTNIYKFLRVKGKSETSWTYFSAMKNHFKDDFLLPWDEINRRGIKTRNQNRPKLLRQRSKSVGAELSRKDASLVIRLDRSLPSRVLGLSEDKNTNSGKKKSVKRTSEGRRRSKSRKKLKTQSRTCVNEEKNKSHDETDQENKVCNTRGPKQFHLSDLSPEGNRERRDSSDTVSSASKVHIINIDHSDIDRNSGNLTINLPSITKQFSDNEFLPLKKRLRIDGDNEKHAEASNEANDSFLERPTVTETHKLTETGENKRLTEEEMAEIMERINKENARNYDINKSDTEKCTNYYGSQGFGNYQTLYSNFDQQCLIVPKEEPVHNYTTANTIPQPPVLLLVIKVDGSTNPIKNATPNQERDIPSESDKRIDSCSDKQGTQSTVLPKVPTDFVKTLSPKNKTIILNKKKDSANLQVIKSNADNDGGVIPNVVNSTTNQVVFGESEQVTVHDSGLEGNEDVDIHVESDVCTVGENVTVYTTEEHKTEQANKTSDSQKTDDVIFREPFPVTEKPNSSKVKLSATVLGNNIPIQPVKLQASTGKVRLPVKVGGKLKEIFISPRELNKIAKLKPVNFKPKSTLSEQSASFGTSASVNTQCPEFNFAGQAITSAGENLSETKNEKINCKLKTNIASQTIEDASTKISHPGGNSFISNRTGKNEDFENESVISEAIGDDDGLKDNLLATVIDFQEQNNQEFIEIKNLMKQNNLLQRETNRLLRLMLEKQ